MAGGGQEREGVTRRIGGNSRAGRGRGVLSAYIIIIYIYIYMYILLWRKQKTCSRDES